MLWGFALRLALLSLQRLHRTWKQDVRHRAGARYRKRCSFHLPGGRTHTDPGRLRPWLQHVLCCPWKPHQKPFPVLPHKGKINAMFFFFLLQSFHCSILTVQNHSFINFLWYLTTKTILKGKANIHLIKDKWVFDQRSANWQASEFVYVPRACCLGLDTFYLHLEPKVKGPCRFGQWFTWSRCSIHLPLFPSLERLHLSQKVKLTMQFLMSNIWGFDAKESINSTLTDMSLGQNNHCIWPWPGMLCAWCPGFFKLCNANSNMKQNFRWLSLSFCLKEIVQYFVKLAFFYVFKGLNETMNAFLMFQVIYKAATSRTIT